MKRAQEQGAESHGSKRRKSTNDNARLRKAVIQQPTAAMQESGRQDSLRATAPSGRNSTVARTHVRFGDDNDPQAYAKHDSELEMNHDPSALEENGEDDDAESDDDAPESISATTAVKANKAMAAGIAQSVQQQKDRDRRKRQERDIRMKDQAASSERRLASRTHGAALQSEPLAEDREGEGLARTAAQVGAMSAVDGASEDEEIPDLLPEELLAEDFTRPPTPPLSLETVKVMTNRHKQRDFKGPKDITIGSINVSVLEKRNNLLPSRANASSKGLRESWLAGRHARGTPAGIVRKPFNNRFVAR